jgi:hypothetical protein
VDTSKALAHISLEDTAYLDQVRGLGVSLYDFQEAFASATIDSSCLPVGPSKVGGRSLLWLHEERKAVVVDALLFDGLKATRGCMAESLEDGETEVLGRYLGPRDAQPARTLIEALIRCDVIQANTHTTAEVYLMAESEGPQGYRSSWVSVDTYFTNRKNVDTYAFDALLEPDGRIVMARTQAPPQ